MALGRPSLIRMRSQVQVLAGPPPIVAGHSAAGSEPGRRCRLGPRWGRTPILAGTSSGPPGPPTRASGSATTTHRGRAPSRGRQPGGGCSHLALQPAPVPTAQPPATGAPDGGLACPVAEWASAAAAARTQPGGPGPLRPPSDHRDLASVARVPASRPSIEPSNHRRPGSHRGPHRFRWSRSPDQLDLSPQRHRLSMGGDRRVRTDGADTRRLDTIQLDTARVDSRRLDTGRVDSRRPSAGPFWTTTPGDRTPDSRTAGQPDPGPPRPDGWTPHAGQRRPTPRHAAGRGDHGADARPLETGWRLLRADAVWASNNQDRSAARTPRAPTRPRMGLATAATVSCRWYAAVQLAPWRTAVPG